MRFSTTNGATVKTVGKKLALPVALSGVLVASTITGLTPGTVAEPDPHGAAASGPTRIDLVAFHQFKWDLGAGAAGYAAMISELRRTARSSAGASTSTVTDSTGARHAVDTTDPSQTAEVADIVVNSLSNTAIHVLVRLSDFYVVQVYYYDAQGQANVLRLAPDVANPGNTNHVGTAPEGYDNLGAAGYADRALTDITVGSTAFNNAVLAVRNFNNWVGTGAVNVYRAAQLFIVGIAEAARFGNISSSVHNAWNSGYRITGSDVDAMHNWGRVSQIYRDNDGTSVTVYNRLIRDARTAASLLLVALGSKGLSKVRKDEL